MTVTAISTNTISSPTSYVGFDIDDTYDEILFTYAGVKGSTDERQLGFQVNTDNDGTLDRPVQSTYYQYWHYVYDYSAGGPNYQPSVDKVYTDENWVPLNSAGDTHETYTSQSGELRIFKPADGDFYKFFQIDGVGMLGHTSDWHRYLTVVRSAGYIRDIAALIHIRFTHISSWAAGTPYQGNITSGTISMYGIS